MRDELNNPTYGNRVFKQAISLQWNPEKSLICDS
jgi:hypothetical protein